MGGGDENDDGENEAINLASCLVTTLSMSTNVVCNAEMCVGALLNPALLMSQT